MKCLQILYMLVLVSFTLNAQEDTTITKRFRQNASLEFVYQKGHVFATNNFLRGTNAEAAKISNYQTYSLKYSHQTTGDKYWEQLYRYPDWGIGIYLADFYNKEEIGYPIALYGFIDAPFHRWKRLSFNYELGFGAAFNWKSFNPITNQYNISIGAGESFFIDAGLNLQYDLDQRLELITGVSLTHFSNGALKKPNFGINTVGPKIGIRYNFNKDIQFQSRPIPVFKAQNELSISAFGGAKNVIFDSLNVDVIEKYEGVYYPVFGISTVFDRQISRKSKIGLGMTISYDGSVNAQAAVDNNEVDPLDVPAAEKLMISIYPSYELVVNRESLVMQPAFYLYRKKFKNQSPGFFQRIGIKYNITDDLFAGLILRDYAFHVSDFIEWTIGYRIKRRTSSRD